MSNLLPYIIINVAFVALAIVLTCLVSRNIWISRMSELRLRLKEKEGEVEAEKRIAENERKRYEENVRGFLASMTAESEKILKQREKDLKEANKSEINEILAPLKESLGEMRKAMRDNEQTHIKNTTELSKQLEQAVKEMQEKTREVGSKAEDLAQALTGRPKIQGDFGENFLEDILTREGFRNGVQYERQYVNDDLSRPDFILHFKEGMEDKDLIVDSKVSLTAYARYVNAEDDVEKKKAISDHEGSVRKHIDELAAKEYPKKGKAYASFAIMFMPIDMALRVAMDKNPDIWQYAYRKGVLIATEQTIMPFIKIMGLTWRKFHQDSNMLVIMGHAEEMIARVADFYKHYKELGNKLRSVCTSYNSGITQLEDHGMSITTSARKVMQLGVKAGKGKVVEVPENRVYLSEEDQESENI